MELLARIPERELMDTAEQAEAYDAADFAEPHDALVARFGEVFPELDTGRVLDLGCGPADVTVRLARAFPGLAVDGVDGAAEMIRLGRRRVTAAGLDGRVRLFEMRLPATAQEWAQRGRYDAVVSTSLLHHLADPLVLWDAVRDAAAPGAAVFVWELRRPASTEVAHELVDRYAAGEPAVLRVDFFNSLCAAYRPEELSTQLDAAGLDLAVDEIGDRHLVVWGRAPR